MERNSIVRGHLIGEIRARLKYLVDVGLGYLTLGRQSRTLSGGEAQRVTLATALGGSLTSTLYVLDEPSVGLHPRDAGRLSGVLKRLAEAGNAVVVVEHDPALIAAAVLAALPAAARDGFVFPSYFEDIMGPLFDYGYGPFRWVCLSGDHHDLEKTDRAAMACIDHNSAQRCCCGSRSNVQGWRLFGGLPEHLGDVVMTGLRQGTQRISNDSFSVCPFAEQGVRHADAMEF